MRKASDEEVSLAMTSGIVFRSAPVQTPGNDKKVKTKAKKKSYKTGLHGSGAAKMKEKIRQKRANRHK